MNKGKVMIEEFVFKFMATRFSGLSHQDEPRMESTVINAYNFYEATEQLKQILHDFRGQNSFSGFTVETSRGFWVVLTKPDPLFDAPDILDHASFSLGRMLIKPLF